MEEDPTPLSLLLELTRAEEPQDPYAFRFEPQSYTLRTSGGGRSRFEIAWSEELLADIEAIRRPERDPAVVQRLGEFLREALDAAGWARLADQLGRASRDGRGGLVTLRANAAELYALPWELLAMGASGQLLGELQGVAVRYEWPATRTAAEEPSPRREGGRVLFAWSAAGGPVPAVEHRRAIQEACDEGYLPFDSGRDELAHASAGRIAEALAEARAAGEPFTVLHLLCHGGRSGSTFGLVLEGAETSPSIVDPGRLRQLLAPHAASLRLVVLAACDGGNSGDPGNHLGSAAQTLHRAGIQAIVASRYPLTVAGSIVLTRRLYRGLLVDLEPLERALVASRGRLARLDESLDWASLQLYARAADGDDTRPFVFRPYRGLLSFEAQQRRFFFGRDAEIHETLGDLQGLIDSGEPRFLVVVGASGTGKSSIVLAGVVPEVDSLRPHRRGAWAVAQMVPGAEPLAALEELLDAREDPRRPLLILVDQFEELFTHVDSPRDREAFTRRLWDLTRRDTGVHCIITLRVDFLGECGEIVLDETGISLDRVGYDEAYRVFVARMSPEQVRAAILGPARRVGLSFSPGLVERILDDVGHEPGALPLLQYALDRLWLAREGRVLSAKVYEALGGLVGALELEADKLIDGLDARQERHARRLLTGLVGIADDDSVDTRQRVKLAELGPTDPAERAVFLEVLQRLVNARLVVREEKGGVTHLVIAHEALIRRWERLHSWIREDRYKLTEIAKLKVLVRQRREHGTLLRGAQLGYACDIVRRHSDDVEASMRELVDDSEARERRKRWLVWVALTVLAGGVVGFAGLSFYALEQNRRAGALLTTTKGLAVGLLDDVLPQLEDVPGTADVRRELHDRVHGILETLGDGEDSDGDLVHYTIWEKIRRGRLANTHGRIDEARQLFAEGLALAEEQVSARPEDVQPQQDLSVILTELGHVELTAGELSDARAYRRRALVIDEGLVALDPSDVRARANVSLDHSQLGSLALEAGDLAEARRRLTEAVRLDQSVVEESPARGAAERQLAETYSLFVLLELTVGDIDAARGFSERSVRIYEDAARAEPDNIVRKIDLLDAIAGRGRVELEAGDYDAALRFLRQSAQGAADIVRLDPENTSYRVKLAEVLAGVAFAELQLGDLASARRHYERSLEICALLTEIDPENAYYKGDMRLALNWLGTLAITAGDYEAAMDYARRAYEVSEALIRDGEESAEEMVDLAGDLGLLAYVKRHGGDLSGARADMEHSLTLLESLVAASPENGEVEGFIAVALVELGITEMLAGETRAAEEHLQSALELQERHLTGEARETRTEFDVSSTLSALGEVALRDGRMTGAHVYLERALAAWEEAREREAGDTVVIRGLVDTLAKLGQVEAGLGEYERANLAYERALSLSVDGLASSPEDSILRFTQVEVLLQMHDASKAQGKDDARRRLEAANEAFAEMARRGQIRGFARREALGERIERALALSRR